MHQRFEGQFKGSDQNELFFQTWTPEKVRGVFVITHGLAEHSDCYHPLAKILAEDGWLVFAWDLRGHGRSEGKRGYVQNISSYIEDLTIFTKTVCEHAPNLNLIFFGHSLGGLVTLRFLQLRDKGVSDPAAVVLSSPATGLSVVVPKIKETVAQIALKWFPKLTMWNEIKYEDLTRDEELRKSYRTDTLRHDKISPGVFLSMVDNFSLAADAAPSVGLPVLMQLAGNDKIVSSEASRTMFERFSGKKNQLIVYPESYHEIYNDLDREQVISDLKKFIHPYLGA